MFGSATRRVNIQYRTIRIEARGEELPQYVTRIQATFGRYTSGKAVVYCNTVQLTKDLGEALGCPSFYHDMEKKLETLDWFRGEGRMIVATSAFGMGIDIPDIRLIVHIGWPRTLMDYGQESGRAGRDGERSEAIVILRTDQWLELPEDPDSRLVQSFVESTGCLGKVLDQYHDGYEDNSGREGRSTPCQNCEVGLASSRVELDEDETTLIDRPVGSRGGVDHRRQGASRVATPPSKRQRVHPKGFEQEVEEITEAGVDDNHGSNRTEDDRSGSQQSREDAVEGRLGLEAGQQSAHQATTIPSILRMIISRKVEIGY
ncbi:MAG: hypothetical protein LQ350_008739 [Teloschistes chrysophthalmus]|nr:MAG: hypothetical protein LQ350_008739 [Niorma chrysophthalma]